MMYQPAMQTRLGRSVAATGGFGYSLTIVCSIHPIAIAPRVEHLYCGGELRE